MKARIQYVRIDWLGNATSDGHRGCLICGPDDGEYVVSIDGSPQRFKADEVRIQLVEGGPFRVGNEVTAVTNTLSDLLSQRRALVADLRACGSDRLTRATIEAQIKMLDLKLAEERNRRAS